MDKLGHGYRPNKGGQDLNDLNGVGIGYDSNTLLIIKLPDSRALRIMSRSLFLAMLLLALPSLSSVITSSSVSSLYEPDSNPDASNGLMILPILLRDLVDEGLIEKGHKGIVLGATAADDFEFLEDAGVDLLTGADLQQKNAVAHQVFDFVFVTSFQGIQVVDTILKDSGLVISPLGRDPSNGQRLLSSFKIVYLRRYESTVVVMRKTGPGQTGSAPSCKRAALKGLEDVYLEPPRWTVLEKKSSFMSRKIKFLPDLLQDSLDEYPRRVFISEDTSAIDWFYNNYPMRHQEFEVLNMEVGSDNNGGVSGWVRHREAAGQCCDVGGGASGGRDAQGRVVVSF